MALLAELRGHVSYRTINPFERDEAGAFAKRTKASSSSAEGGRWNLVTNGEDDRKRNSRKLSLPTPLPG